MNALRIERLVWSAVVGALLGAPLALRLTPDTSGPVYLGLAAVGFLGTTFAVYRLLGYGSSLTRRGELTVHFTTFFAVALPLLVALDFAGFGGLLGNVVAYAAGAAATTRVGDWLTARRRDDSPLSS